MQLIVASQNDYLVAVKGNQPKLLAHFRQVTHTHTPNSVDTSVDRTHGRLVQRTVRVYDQVLGMESQWHNAKSLIAVHRQGRRDGQEFDSISYYLSSLNLDAITFSCGIRGHRDIENGLHWVKDVVFGEDAARFPAFNAATNWSIVRNIVINLLRSNGYRSLTKALRFVRHDIDKLFTLLTMN